MIKVYTKIDDFKKDIDKLKHDVDIETLTSKDFTFFEHDDGFTLIYIPDYDLVDPENIIVVHEKDVYLYTTKKFNNYQKEFSSIIKKSYGESTAIILVLLKTILKNYSQEFDKVRTGLTALEEDPILDKVEESGRSLRRLTDRFEELYQLIIVLKERDIKEFNTSYIMFDYDILNAEARYWLDKCRSHVYRISSLRTKSEMKSTRELNATMRKLTVIMTFLTIVGIVVNVPSSVGGVFGIPAFSDAYFKNNIQLMVWALILSTGLSALLGLWYWKSLKLSHK